MQDHDIRRFAQVPDGHSVLRTEYLTNLQALATAWRGLGIWGTIGILVLAFFTLSSILSGGWFCLLIELGLIIGALTIGGGMKRYSRGDQLLVLTDHELISVKYPSDQRREITRMDLGSIERIRGLENVDQWQHGSLIVWDGWGVTHTFPWLRDPKGWATAIEAAKETAKETAKEAAKETAKEAGSTEPRDRQDESTSGLAGPRRHCTECGEPLIEEAGFCGECGTMVIA